jgi:hypothetical protein
MISPASWVFRRIVARRLVARCVVAGRILRAAPVAFAPVAFAPVAFAVLAFAVLAFPTAVTAQAISTIGLERSVDAETYWRITYENDFFGATDRYYTQGVHLEFVHPRLRLPVVSRLLFAPAGMRSHFGVAFEDDGYTSSDLKQATIPLGDHPYAGTKQLRAFVISNDSARTRVISSSLTVGLIGPGAGGREIQTFIHRRTGNTIPMGWTHQIRNDLLLNYELSGERAMHRAGSLAQLSVHGTGRLGTFHTALTTGTTLMFGRLPRSSRSEQLGTTPRALYVYLKPQLQLVGYDATLQGGVFNRTSPYTIASRDLTRAVYRQHAGLVYRSGTRFIEVFRSYHSRTFATGRSHRSGGVSFGFGLPQARPLTAERARR